MPDIPDHPTIRQALQQAWRSLNNHTDATVDVELLLMHVCDLSRAALWTKDQQQLSDDQQSRYFQLIEQRKKGWPIAYLVQHKEFWSLNFFVSPASLIPRPETELLVEQTLAHIPVGEKYTVADLGTGCGAVAAAIASERPQCHIIATDSSTEALDIAKDNINNLKLANIEYRLGSWFNPLENRRFHVIVSNPPYIASNDPYLQQGDIRFEPQQALISGGDGLDALRQIITQAQQYLHPGGWLLFEHGYDQAKILQRLCTHGGYVDFTSYRDLAGLPRVIACRSPITDVD